MYNLPKYRSTTRRVFWYNNIQSTVLLFKPTNQSFTAVQLIHTCRYHKHVRGFIGETSVPVGEGTLINTDHVAVGHILDDIRVSTAAWKSRWTSLSTKADENLLNRHKCPTHVWRQLESRHAPKTMGETSKLLTKYEQYEIAPTSELMLDITALSDTRAQL